MKNRQILKKESSGTYSFAGRPGKLHLRGSVLLLFTLSLLLFTACSKGTDSPATGEAAAPDKEESVAAVAVEVAPSPKLSPDAAAGKIVFEKHCHYCHGNKGLGNGPVGIAISPHPADFVHDDKRMKKTDKELFKSISEGVKRDIGGEAMNMPSWKGILSETERWNVLAYIRQLRREGKAAEEAAR